MKIAALDIETLSLEPNAFIYEIGIVVEEWNDLNVAVSSTNFKLKPNFVEQLTNLRHVSQDTIAWHNDRLQPKNISNLLNESSYEEMSIVALHSKLSNIFEDCQEIWINGLSYDPVVLASLFKVINKKLPYSYSKERDVRTIYNGLRKYQLIAKNKDVAHDAILDAIWNLTIARSYHIAFSYFKDNDLNIT